MAPQQADTEHDETSVTPMPSPDSKPNGADPSTDESETSTTQENLGYETKRDRLLDGIHQAYHEAEQANRDAMNARNEMNQKIEELSEQARRLESRATELRGDGELDPLEDLDRFDSQQAVDEQAREYEERAKGKRSTVEDIRQDIQRGESTTEWGHEWQQAQEQAREAKKTAEKREERLTLLVDFNQAAPSFATEDELDEHVNALIDEHDWEPSNEDRDEDEGEDGESASED